MSGLLTTAEDERAVVIGDLSNENFIIANTTEQQKVLIQFQLENIRELTEKMIFSDPDSQFVYEQMLGFELLLRSQNLKEIEETALSLIELNKLKLDKYIEGITYEVEEASLLLIRKKMLLKNTTQKNEIQTWLLEIGIDIETGNLLGVNLFRTM